MERLFLYSEETLDLGYQRSREIHDQIRTDYEKIKDAEVVTLNVTSLVPMSVQFPMVSELTVGEASSDASSVSIKDLSLTLTDTTLLSEGTEYVIHYAFLNPVSGLTLAYSSSNSTLYEGENEFTVTSSDWFHIPTLAQGEYVLVAYIATADEGIRVCTQKAIPFGEITPMNLHDGNVILTTKISESGQLVLTATHTVDTMIFIYDNINSYDELYERLSEESYKFGFIVEGAKIEQLDSNEEWAILDPNAEYIYNGYYRLQYNIINGNMVSEGYVIAAYRNINDYASSTF